MTKKYRSIQMSLDGAYIFDHEGDTPQEVWNQVNDQGSKWFFFPIPFIVTNNPGQNFRYSKIIDTPDYPDYFRELKGKSTRKARQFIIDNQELIQASL
jgi:hypothetical protein